MDLNVADLAAQGLDLTWDGPGGRERKVVLSPSEGVTGLYSIDPKRHLLDAATDEALVLAELVWPMAEGEVRLHGDAPLTRLAVDLTIPRGGDGGTRGQVGAGAVTVPAIDVQLPSLGPKPLRVAGLTLLDAAIALDGEGTMAIVAASGEIDRINLTLGSTEVAIEEIALEGLKAKRSDGTWVVQIAVASAQWARVETASTSLRLATLDLRRLALDGGDLSVGNLQAAEVELRLPELGGGGHADEGAGDEDANGRDGAGQRQRLDLTALDRLGGKIDVDVTADTTAPIIGVRRATHHFRLKVDHGAINYYRLEKSLSALEDALLDFRVIERKLRLVADVPFVALDKKTVVSWPLPDDEELALANRRLIRLRRLLDYQLPRRSGSETAKKRSGGERSSGKGKKSSFEVRELRFDGIDVELRWSGGDRVVLPGGGAVVMGAPNRPAVAELTIRGGLRYSPQEATAGTLDIGARRVRIALEALQVGRRMLDLDRFRCDAIDAQLGFAGVRPRTFEAKLTAVRLRDLALRADVEAAPK